MVKEKRILSYFIGWLIVGFIVCFVGINNIFASTIIIPGSASFYDNNGTYVERINTIFDTTVYEGTFTTTADSYGGLISFQSNTTLQKGYIYTVFVLVGADNFGGYTRPSTKTSIGIGSTYAESTSSYINNINPSSYSASSGTTEYNSKGVYYTFVANQTGNYISVPYTSQNTCTNCLQSFYGYSLELVGDSNKLTEEEVNNLINNQKNEINSSIQNSTDTIINNQNQNNDELKDTINENFNSCRPGNNLFNLNNWYNSLTSNNGTISLNNHSIEFIAISNSMTNIISNYNFKLKPSTTYTLSFNANIENSFDYNTWLNLGLEAIDNVSYGTLYINSNGYYTKTFTTNSNGDFYLKGYVNTNVNNNNQVKLILNNIMLNEGSSAKTYEKYGEICQNKIDETNDKLDDIEGALTDSSTPNLDILEDSVGWLPAGPVDSILNLPLTMMNSLLNSLTTACAPLNLTLPYVNKNIQIPCLSSIFAQITGVQGLWIWVGTIASVLILYNYLLNLYAWVDRVLTLRAEFDEAMGADLANWGRL